MNEALVTELCNEFVVNLENKKATYLDVVAFCGQILIRSGCTMSDGKYTLSTIKWADLENEYYAGRTKNLPLALILLGGSVMGFVKDCEETYPVENLATQEVPTKPKTNKIKRKLNGKDLPSTPKILQKSSSARRKLRKTNK